MKKLFLGTLALFMLINFNGCGGLSSDSTPPNNKTTGISTLLKGGYSNDTKGSLSLTKLNDGTDIINGISVMKVKSESSITLDNGFTLVFDDTLVQCTLTTTAETIPTAATIGTTSNGTAIYSCDDSTNRTMSWSLSDAGNANANYIFKTVISGALQSENTSIITITPQNKIIYYKIYVNVIAQGITGTFEGTVN